MEVFQSVQTSRSYVIGCRKNGIYLGIISSSYENAVILAWEIEKLCLREKPDFSSMPAYSRFMYEWGIREYLTAHIKSGKVVPLITTVVPKPAKPRSSRRISIGETK